MDRSQADALVTRLGEELGIAGLALDDGGSCTLFIDDGAVIVNLGHNPQAQSIDLMTCLDAVEPGRALLARLLEANFGWRLSGATFAIEPGSGSVILQRRLTAAEAAADGGLRSALDSLIAAAEAWSARLSAPETPQESDSPTAPERPSEWRIEA
jgi:Tir chaperone protein (CesT) family